MSGGLRPSPAARGSALALLVACWLTSLPGAAGATGAWQTFLRARDFTDLIVTDEAVWGATAEAGLWRFDRLTRRLENITREPGNIASNNLTSLAIDRVGRLWVGTAGSGVSRLSADGKSWSLVNAFDGLPVDGVTTMTVVGDTLWIGTRGGIALWDGRQVLGALPDGNTDSFDTTFKKCSRPEDEPFFVTGVVQLADTVWLSTRCGVGFARTTTNLADWRPANAGLPTLTVDHLASDGRSLFAQADGWVYRWEPDSLKWFTIGFIGVVHSLKADHGTVLVSTERGIWRYNPGTRLFDLIPDSPASAPSDGDDPEPSVDPSGIAPLYAGSAAGLWEQPAAAGAWTLYPLPGPPANRYANIVIDGGRVYAATRSDGIGRWDGTDWFAWLPVSCGGECPNSFRHPVEVFAMLADPAGLKWISCWGVAMERFDDAVVPDAFTHFWTAPGDDSRHTLAFGAAADSNGGRWFGMDTNNLGVIEPLGLDYYDSTGAHAGTWGPGLPAGSLVRGGKIRAVTVDKAGRIWVGYAGAANSGVDHFVRRPEVGYDFKTVANTTSFDVWGIVAHGDSIWVLTDRELRRISRTSVPPRLVQRFDTPAGRPLGMRLLDVAPNGDVYVGSEEGVRRYRTDGTTEDFTTRNSALASDDVRAVAVDRATGVVWFGTAEGLNRFDPGYRPPVLPPGAEDTLHVFPNPAVLTGLGVKLWLLGTSAAYSGGIYDVGGRLLHRFSTTPRGQVFWDGRDRDGTLVKPGVYFLSAEGEGRQARTRFVLLH